MKKIFILIALISLIFSACTEKELVDTSVPQGALIFKISTDNSLQTRRSDVYSRESVHNISRVHILVYQKATGVYVSSYLFDDWTSTDTLRIHTIPQNMKVPAGEYRFIAAGFPPNTAGIIGFDPLLALSTYESVTAYMSAVMKLPEVFAGTNEATIAANNNGNIVEIEMSRVVSGVLGYFKNIPAQIGESSVTSLRLTTSNNNRKVLLRNGEGIDPLGETYNLFNINLNGREVQNGVYVGNTPIADVVQLENSQLSGNFINPINGISMTLGLYDVNGVALKTWDVALDGIDTTFNLEANHFYALGRKLVAGTTTGTDLDSPDDDDLAIDLSSDNPNIIIYISTDWDAIYDIVFPNGGNNSNINYGEVNLDDNNWDGIQ